MATIEIIPNIPMDILYKILEILPVKSLLRFKSVCKSWYALINSSDFIKSHLNHSIETESHSFFVSLSIGRPIEESYLHHIPEFHQFSLSSTKLKLPSYLGAKNFRIVGSSNGLVCLCFYNNAIQLALVNPSTRMFWAVPNGPFNLSKWQCFGFGFDVRGDDYKVVRVSTTRKFMIYSLKTNSWRIFRHPGKLPRDHDHGVLLNNRLHWKVEDNDEDIYRLFSFDLHDEEWREVPLPNIYNSLSDPDDFLFAPYSLGVLDGCLCVYCSFLSDDYPDHGYSEIWIMREYGVKESWEMLYSFPYVGVDPLGSCSKDGCEVLLSKPSGSWFIWNSKLKNTVRKIDETDPPMLHLGVVKCIESLVPLMDNCCVLEEHKRVARREESQEMNHSNINN